MTLTRKLADALESLLPFLHQEEEWLRGDLIDDDMPGREEMAARSLEALKTAQARIESYERMIAEARQ